MLKESPKCVFCGGKPDEVLNRVSVGESSMIFTDDPVCKGCKKAYDQGYKDGLDDSV